MRKAERERAPLRMSFMPSAICIDWIFVFLSLTYILDAKCSSYGLCDVGGRSSQRGNCL